MEQTLEILLIITPKLPLNIALKVIQMVALPINGGTRGQPELVPRSFTHSHTNTLQPHSSHAAAICAMVHPFVYYSPFVHSILHHSFIGLHSFVHRLFIRCLFIVCSLFVWCSSVHHGAMRRLCTFLFQLT